MFVRLNYAILLRFEKCKSNTRRGYFLTIKIFMGDIGGGWGGGNSEKCFKWGGGGH